MRGRASFLRTSVVLCGLLELAAASIGCSSSKTPTTGSELTLTPTIVVPQGLIAEVKVFALQVYPALPDGGTPITCNTTTGALGGGFMGVKGLARSDGGPDDSASESKCSLGVEACFLGVTLPQSESMVLSITAYRDAAMMSVLAVGCTTLTTTTATTATATIQLHPTEVCGDGILEVPETCDPGGMTDEECPTTGTTACQTNIDLLSSGNGPGANTSNTVTGSPGDKRDPSFLWPSGGNFLAFFSDDSTPTMEQISMSVRGPTFAPTATGNITDTESIYVPNSPSAFPPAAEGFDHKQPVAVQSQGDTYVVFAYDAGGSYAIVLRSMTSDLDAVQGMGSPCAVSDATGDPGNLTSPSVAVSSINGSDVFFIAWQDDPGNIYGRTYTPTATGACGTLGAQVLLSTGTANSHPSVAGVTSNNPAGTPGWVVVWQSDQIALLPIGGDGSPVHAQKLLGPGTAPTVASIPGTGNYTVAWSDVTLAGSAAIFALRFGAESSPIDSTPAQISESSNGDEATPFIAGSPAGGGSYVVTWVDQGGNQEVRARLLSNMVGGYLSNAIDGTTGEFIVSDVAGQTPNLRTRVSPTVVVGGASPGYMAFGWADNTASGTFGILGRRFPLPAQ